MTRRRRQDARGGIVTTVPSVAISSITSQNYSIRVAIEASQYRSPSMCLAGDPLGGKFSLTIPSNRVGPAAPLEAADRTYACYPC